MAGYGWQKEAE